MNTKNLTSKSNDSVIEARFTGSFGQPDGFGSVLTLIINKAGNATLTLNYKDVDNIERMWSVMLDNEQRRKLANMLTTYEPSFTAIDKVPLLVKMKEV